MLPYHFIKEKSSLSLNPLRDWTYFFHSSFLLLTEHNEYENALINITNCRILPGIPVALLSLPFQRK